MDQRDRKKENANCYHEEKNGKTNGRKVLVFCEMRNLKKHGERETIFNTPPTSRCFRVMPIN